MILRQTAWTGAPFKVAYNRAVICGRVPVAVPFARLRFASVVAVSALFAVHLLNGCVLPHAEGPRALERPDVVAMDRIEPTVDNPVVVPDDVPNAIEDTYVAPDAQCGRVDLDCCAGNVCNDGTQCYMGRCVCGIANALCCPGEIPCNAGTVCAGAGAGARCVSCGGAGQACCIASGREFCSGASQLCLSGICRDCGNPGQPCCVGNRCNASNICSPEGICVVPSPMGMEGCGDRYERCCPGVAPCEGSLACVGGACVECGGTNGLCCPGQICTVGNVCTAGACLHCGGLGELCCPGNRCDGRMSCTRLVLASRCF